MTPSSDQFVTIGTFLGIVLSILGFALISLISVLIWVFKTTKSSFDSFSIGANKKFDSLIKSINDLHAQLREIIERTKSHGEEIEKLRDSNQQLTIDVARLKERNQ